MKTLVIALLVLAGCGREDRTSAAVPARDAAKILESTPWFDRAPQTETDVIHLWAFMRGEGVYFTGNAYKGSFEAFRYFVEEDLVKLRMLDENKTYSTHFRIERFEDRVFDWKLTLDGAPRGPTVYYGIDQHHGHHGQLPAIAARILERIR
jgi:hypothetical protein